MPTSVYARGYGSFLAISLLSAPYNPNAPFYLNSIKGTFKNPYFFVNLTFNPSPKSAEKDNFLKVPSNNDMLKKGGI